VKLNYSYSSLVEGKESKNKRMCSLAKTAISLYVKKAPTFLNSAVYFSQ
jgi:hypothetical protein